MFTARHRSGIVVATFVAATIALTALSGCSDATGSDDSQGSDTATTGTDTMTGGVYMADGSGLVPGTAVVFHKAGCSGCLSQPNTTTDRTGHYSIDLARGSYDAECDVTNLDYECGPVDGNGGPFIVTIPSIGHLDFVVCLVREYPVCLGSGNVPRG